MQHFVVITQLCVKIVWRSTLCKKLVFSTALICNTFKFAKNHGNSIRKFFNRLSSTPLKFLTNNIVEAISEEQFIFRLLLCFHLNITLQNVAKLILCFLFSHTLFSHSYIYTTIGRIIKTTIDGSVIFSYYLFRQQCKTIVDICDIFSRLFHRTAYNNNHNNYNSTKSIEKSTW